MEKPGKRKTHVLRPLLWWFLLVLVLFGIRTHQRLMEKTRLVFTVTMEGQPRYDAVATFDGKPATSGQNIPLGNHTFSVTLAKGDPFTTNLFVWYGEHNFGAIDLKRTTGTLTVASDPPASMISITGPEFSTNLYGSAGANLTIPTDQYTVRAEYPHWSQTLSPEVFANQTTPSAFAPKFGAIHFTCNQDGATCQLRDSNNQYIDGGTFPKTVAELTAGTYQLTATIHQHILRQQIELQTGSTNECPVTFIFGMASVDSTPQGASVMDRNYTVLGTTPLQLSELDPGVLNITVQLPGYESVPATLEITANETNTFQTNLISSAYVSEMRSARAWMGGSDYLQALVAADNALKAKPDDADAIALKREATGMGKIQHAKELAQRGDYVGGTNELTLALQLLPDNAEARQLLADYQQRESQILEQEKEKLEQQKRIERYNAPKQAFDAALGQSDYAGANNYQPLKFTTTRLATDVGPAIINALTNISPAWVVTRFEYPVPDIFVIEARQPSLLSLRKCVIVGGQAKDDETQIWCKVLEYDTSHTLVVQGLLSLKDNVQYTPVYPSASADPNDYRQERIREGLRVITQRISQAIGQ